MAQVVRWITILLLSAVAFGCGNNPMHSGFQSTQNYEFDPLQRPVTTGHRTVVTSPEDGRKIEVNYTTSGHQDIFQELVAESQASDPLLNENNMTFAPEIEDADVIREIHPASQVNILKIDVKLKSLEIPLKFIITIHEQNLLNNSKSVFQESFNSPDSLHKYRLAAQCTVRECPQAKLYLQKLNLDGELLAESYSLFTTMTTTAKVQVARDDKPTAEQAELIEKINRGKATKETISVVNGPTLTQVEVTDPESGETILTATAPVLDTHDTSTPVSNIKVKTAKGEIEAQAKVAGNNPATGEMTIDIDLGPENERISIRADFDLEELPTPTEIDNIDYSQAVIPFNTGAYELGPVTSEYTQALEKYRNDPTVLKYIGHIQKSQSTGQRRVSRKRLQNFLNTIVPFSEVLVTALNKSDIPPQLMYIAVIESEYFIYDGKKPHKSGNDIGNVAFSTQVTNSQSTASGPMQIINGTADLVIRNFGELSRTYDYDFTREELVYNSQEKRKELTEKDSRRYLIPTMIMAGSYGKYIYTKYFSDPGVIPLAYNKGHGIGDKYQFESRHGKFRDITLKEIAQKNMAPVDGIDYAYWVLAAQIIGSNPAAHKFYVQPPMIDIETFANIIPPGTNFDQWL